MLLRARRTISACAKIPLMEVHFSKASLATSAWMLPRDALIDIKSIRRLFFYCELVHADDDLLFGFDGPLILIRCLSDFFLRISALDGFDHAAHGVELAEIVQGTALHFKR